mmetsp:Transcript_53089/g.170054  ORF Transcript_53089/g.170054 Transcript_53089/m.170054 type:complete len:332 (-) Transcript_53089:95-1090(-)
MAEAPSEPGSSYQPLGEQADAAALPLRRQSSRLLRAASVTFTGGAAVLPPSTPQPDAAAEEPVHERQTSGIVRQQSTMRNLRRNEVQSRMLAEIWNRFRVRIITCFAAVVILAFTMMFLVIWAIYAAVTCYDLPCDQPLHNFVFVSMLVGQLKQSVLKIFAPERAGLRPWVAIAAAVPGWVVIWWGVLMLRSCRTCQETNPGLYYPTKYLICGQILLCVLMTLFFSIGFTPVLHFLSSMKDRLRPGCEQAVHLLPKVPNDAQELIDSEDGRVMECPICTESLAGAMAVVRTPCDHYFHEGCLARWCKSHVDCPMCRAQVGEIDMGGSEADP